MKPIEREMAKLRLAFEALAKRLEQSDVALLPLPQAAKRLGISKRTLRRRIDAGLIFPKEWGGRLFIPSAEIDRVAAPVAAPTSRTGGGRPRAAAYSARAEAAKMRERTKRRRR